MTQGWKKKKIFSQKGIDKEKVYRYTSVALESLTINAN